VSWQLDNQKQVLKIPALGIGSCSLLQHNQRCPLQIDSLDYFFNEIKHSLVGICNILFLL